MRLFRPHITYNHYLDIDLTLLKDLGINTILFDIDNTLAPHDQKDATKDNIDFILKTKSMGFKVFIISNNVEERVETFAKDLNLKTYPFAMKPLKKTYQRIVKENDHLGKIAIVGDQLLTDILGGNRMKFITIYTKPIAPRDLNVTKINRNFERVLLNNMKKKGLLEVGKYYK